MNCCQCQGLEEVFSPKAVARELQRYRRSGPPRTTRMLIEALQAFGTAGMTLLDIGGGVGAVQHALLSGGVQSVTGVEASPAYLDAARAEARRRGLEERVRYRRGNFVDLAADIGPADIVTLDRVICCYDDMPRLVGLSAARARRLYGVVYPLDNWWIKWGLAAGNLYLRLRRSHYRAYVHTTHAVEALLASQGFNRQFYRSTLVWQVAVFAR